MSEAMVADAMAWEGTPFHHGQRARGLGCDEIGFVAAMSGDDWATKPYSRFWRDADTQFLLMLCLRHMTCVAIAAHLAALAPDAAPLPPPIDVSALTQFVAGREGCLMLSVGDPPWTDDPSVIIANNAAMVCTPRFGGVARIDLARLAPHAAALFTVRAE